ncbi:hypothetical protein [Ursidibacter sp. B-7004-1]
MKAVNKIKVMLGIGILMFGGNVVTVKANEVIETIKQKNQHIQQIGTDWYFEHRYGTPNKERQELWLGNRTENPYYKKYKEWLSQKITEKQLKQALKLTSPLNKNTSKTLSQEEIQALKIETKVLRQQFANYLNYYDDQSNGSREDKLYQDKFRFLYNRSKDLIILMIDNKVKDKELLEMTLEYRKALEKEFLAANRWERDIFTSRKVAEKYGKNDSPDIKEFIKKHGIEERNKIIKQGYREIKQRDDVKKFNIIAEQYKEINATLEEYINIQNIKVIN